MSLAGAPARALARNGRPMELRRRVGTTTATTNATVQGYLVAFNPQEITGLVQMGDARVTIGPDVGALTAPKAGDMLHIDGAGWRVMGASPLNVGAMAAGWRLWVRGGSA